MREFFRGPEETAFKRLQMLRTEVSDQQLHSSPCPLLRRQLNELEVMTAKLLQAVHQMQKLTNHEDWA